jgi:hypothetical protein
MRPGLARGRVNERRSARAGRSQEGGVDWVGMDAENTHSLPSLDALGFGIVTAIRTPGVSIQTRFRLDPTKSSDRTGWLHRTLTNCRMCPRHVPETPDERDTRLPDVAIVAGERDRRGTGAGSKIEGPSRRGCPSPFRRWAGWSGRASAWRMTWSTWR